MDRLTSTRSDVNADECTAHTARINAAMKADLAAAIVDMLSEISYLLQPTRLGMHDLGELHAIHLLAGCAYKHATGIEPPPFTEQTQEEQ